MLGRHEVMRTKMMIGNPVYKCLPTARSCARSGECHVMSWSSALFQRGLKNVSSVEVGGGRGTLSKASSLSPVSRKPMCRDISSACSKRPFIDSAIALSRSLMLSQSNWSLVLNHPRVDRFSAVR